MKKNILLLGGSGNLGSNIVKSKLFKNLKSPPKKILNILNKVKIEKYLMKNKIDLVIHGAGIARVKTCEKNKKKAYNTNVTGTSNIVNSIIKIKKKFNKDIKIVFISSDAVYPSTKGNYKETDKPKHYNYYGYTKIKGEKLIKKTQKYIIIRTRFFDKRKIPFSYSAVNIYNSGLEVSVFIRFLKKLINKNFHGIINVGGKRISDYKKYKKYKKNLKPVDKSKIFDELNFRIAIDASLNIKKLKKFL
tara:strand:+ start:351 stop:1091 length:741 start_codon:yes stop_codon:yes gene_type:complete